MSTTSSLAKFASLLLLSSSHTLCCFGQTVPESVVLEKHQLEGGSNRVWVYAPRKLPVEKIPCVLIAPAGSRLMDGISISEGDMAEHLPYVEAGFAVVTYDISSPLPEDPSEDDIMKTVSGFAKRNCGIDDARDAIKLALEKHAFIDPSQLYVAGHSSAGTLALQVAQNAPKIRGCMVFAPVTNVTEWLGEDSLKMLKPTGLPDSVQALSPHLHVDKIQCPNFLFHANDDDVVEAPSVAAYMDLLKGANKKVEFRQVTKGGHYDGMVAEGIPAAIVWLKQQVAETKAP